jgi:hypothetical protein
MEISENMMFRWMCGMNQSDRIDMRELRRLGIGSVLDVIRR